MAESTATVNQRETKLGRAVIKQQGHLTTPEEDAKAHAEMLERFNYNT